MRTTPKVEQREGGGTSRGGGGIKQREKKPGTKKEIGNHARPRQASATSPLRNGGSTQRGNIWVGGGGAGEVGTVLGWQWGRLIRGGAPGARL